MAFGLIASAFLLGLRHGIDWDHLAAISDIAASQDTPRRGVFLSTLYVIGHAAVVFSIGAVAIATGQHLPAWADDAMGVVVGWTLVLLGLYVAYTLIRYRGSVPLRSRWMIVLSGVRKAYVAIRSRLAPVDTEPLVHEHAHSGLTSFHHDGDEAPVEQRLPRHGHRHSHDPSNEPFTNYSSRTAVGIGMLHGIGAETPTQVLVFLAAAEAGGTVAGMLVLTAFLAGLAIANSAITVGAAFGFFASRGRRWVHTSLAGATVVVSLTVGLMLIAGQDGTLPALFAG